MLQADRWGLPIVIFVTARHTVWPDDHRTLPLTPNQPLSGLWLFRLAGVPLGEKRLLISLPLYAPARPAFAAVVAIFYLMAAKPI